MEGSVFQLYSAEQIVRYGIAILFALASVLAVLYSLWGTFLMIVSSGSEDKVKTAVNHIRYAVLGIIMLVVILFVSPILLNLIGLGMYSDYFQPSTILSTVQEVMQNIFGGSASGGHYNPSGASRYDDFESL